MQYTTYMETDETWDNIALEFLITTGEEASTTNRNFNIFFRPYYTIEPNRFQLSRFACNTLNIKHFNL
jgi:hypothetical protein